MQHTLWTIIVFLASVASAYSQVDVRSVLSDKFRNADSVVLVTHDFVKGSTDEAIDANGRIVEFPTLLFGNAPNPTITKQKKVLSKKESSQLASIILEKYTSRVLSQGGCFVPHHAIFFYKAGRISYIDLCFYCMSTRTSEDFGGMLYLETKQWEKLEKYFEHLGLTYEHNR